MINSANKLQPGAASDLDAALTALAIQTHIAHEPGMARAG